ncbi:MAG TPA: hypothetical protein VFT72_05070 [Opitutaceae bacterium]|nr:hypothetical protein [Opitutaceae bacterium]
MPKSKLSVLGFLAASSLACACDLPPAYQDKIEASVAARDPKSDATVFQFYSPARGQTEGGEEHCFVICHYTPGSKTHGPTLMVIHGAFYFIGDLCVAVEDPTKIKWIDPDPSTKHPKA